MLPFLQGVARRPPEGLFAPASCPVIPSQSADWRGNPFPAPAGAELPSPPSAREVARLCRDGGRDITRTHPRCSSVGGDAHAAKQVPLGCIAPHTAPAVSFRASPQTGVGIRSPRRRRGTPLASLCEAAQCSHWVVRRSVAEVSRPLAVTEGETSHERTLVAPP